MRRICQGGPFDGQQINTDETGITFVFTAKGQTGFYYAGVWHAVPQH